MSVNKELVKLLGNKFIQRKDVKAFQRDTGEWYPEDKPFTMLDFENHLSGKTTLGHYMLDQDSMCKLFAFDIDLVKHDRSCEDRACKGCSVRFPNLAGDGELKALVRDCWIGKSDDSEIKQTLTINLRCMAEGLAQRIDRLLGIPVAILNSGGKGLHVYGFTGSIPAEVAREMALGILEGFGCFIPKRGQNFFMHETSYPVLEIEVFPKQGTLKNKEYGNLMSLPLGINRKSKLPKTFVHCKSSLNTLPVMDPMLALNGDQPWE